MDDSAALVIEQLVDVAYDQDTDVHHHGPRKAGLR